MSAYETGKFRNVFAELGYDEKEIKERLESMFQTMFYGEEGVRVYYPVGDDMGYMTDTGNNDVRTEGMSYGMMMCLQLDKKEEFDRIWKWTKTYMYLDKGPNAGYFRWSCNLDGTSRAEGAAPDGEEFFAMTLLFASRKWGDGEGIFEYSKQAKELLKTAVHGKNPMWDPNNHYIKFICECDWTDPSYHLPHFYEMYAELADEEDKELWKLTAKESREYLKKACHPETGMSAEYAEYDGSPNNRPFVAEGFGWRHDWFYSDAYRTIANIGLDYSWFEADEWEVEIAKKLRLFFADKCEMVNGEPTYPIYEIDGTKVLGSKMGDTVMHPYGLIATNAMSALASKEGEMSQDAIDAVKLFWNTPLRTGERRYYDNCLQLFAMMALSGNYRLYK